jgi:hypothetical protein
MAQDQFKRKLTTILAPLFAAILIIIVGCGGGGGSANSNTVAPPPVSSPPAVPATGVYLGALLMEGLIPIEEFNSDLGVQHALFSDFFEFPEILSDADEKAKFNSFFSACVATGAIPMISLRTYGGLESYTTQQIISFADFLAGLNVAILLRWNHEMNGSWHAWAQQPTLYVQKFQEFAGIIHEHAPNVAMVWTPNQGWGYPWPGREYSIAQTDPDFTTLDTNGDGVLTEMDDPYTPYYPGDDSVDWVGLCFYHWGNTADLGRNEVPLPEKWGEANGIGGPIPNFHDVFAVGHDKPMIIAETAALYDPADTKGGGADEADIKIAWIDQVYNLNDTSIPTLADAFPMLKAIVWFSNFTYESETGFDIDWTLTSNQEVNDHYREVVADPYFIKAP